MLGILVFLASQNLIVSISLLSPSVTIFTLWFVPALCGCSSVDDYLVAVRDLPQAEASASPRNHPSRDTLRTSVTVGKQTRTPVPKFREGTKATECLGRVYVDLCGPMAVVSHTHNLYLMNIIDDFSSYIWCIPLRSKSDAFSSLQTWHKAVTVQTGNTLRILVTNNGELVSNAMRVWCNTLGINHQLTAPRTSAQNGRIERLHRMILGKACTMRIACNTPGSLWDEFCLTTVHLTRLTAATANQGRTPYQLWFGWLPSLSHLREIGCNAYALHTPSPSKIYARSLPCILIGYAPPL